jgi:hypothetical protein
MVDDAVGDVSGSALAGVRAIVLVPGFQRAERWNRRDALVRGLCAQEARPLRAGPSISLGGVVGVKLLPAPGDARGGEVHVFEAYWADMFAEVATPSPWSRLVQGLGLITYWMHVRMLRALRVSRYMTFGLVGGGLVLVLWYVSTFVLAAEAIAADESLTPDGLPKWLSSGIVAIGERIGGWRLWATVTLLLPLVRADEVARLAAFARRYLENRASDTELGLRDRVRQRVLETIDPLVAAGYGEVLVVAHSFGAIVANDIFADRTGTAGGTRIELVTWGSPAAVMQHRSSWLRGEIERLRTSTGLARWVDVHSNSDWLCSQHPGRSRSAIPGEARLVDFDAPFLQRMIGRTHLEYYNQPAALAPLLET